jgi:flagellar biosynthesis/type III secretory pathway M-ring protein FliF/YscJ
MREATQYVRHFSAARVDGALPKTASFVAALNSVSAAS